MNSILVVEDELTIVQVLTTILREEGYVVYAVGNGQEALESIERQRPDLVLSDVMMPVMDGRELCERIQADPDHSSVPVILMSSVYRTAKLEGCNYAALLKKPFEIDVLLATVRNIIAEHSGKP